jgi:hypothetical protein
MRSGNDSSPTAVTAIAGQDVNDLEVEISAATLDRLGFRRVVASPTARAADIHALIAQLHETHSEHTWRSFSPHDTGRIAEELLAFENHRRATRVFFYHGLTHAGGRMLLGTGAVSPELRKTDAPPGFAVVSRCYILQRFRNERLYAPFLRHRVEQARALLGDRLHGIHFGSSNPRVFYTIRNNVFPVRFLYLGRECVGCCADSFLVHDFLGLSERFRNDLLLPPLDPHARATGSAAELHVVLAALCRDQLGLGGYRRLKRLVDATDLAAAFPGDASRAIRSLLAFMAAIPILEEDAPAADRVAIQAAGQNGVSDV